jgi:hypothetical protein
VASGGRLQAIEAADDDQSMARPDDLRKDQPMTQTTPTSTDRTAWIVAVIAFVVTLAMIVAEIN